MRFNKLNMDMMKRAIHSNILIYRAFCNLACEYVISGYCTSVYRLYFKNTEYEVKYQSLVYKFKKTNKDEDGYKLIRYHDYLVKLLMPYVHQNVDEFISVYCRRLKGDIRVEIPYCEEKRYAQELATMIVDENCKLLPKRYSPKGEIPDAVFTSSMKKLVISYTGGGKKTAYVGHQRVTWMPADLDENVFIENNKALLKNYGFLQN